MDPNTMLHSFFEITLVLLSIYLDPFAPSMILMILKISFILPSIRVEKLAETLKFGRIKHSNIESMWLYQPSISIWLIIFVPPLM